MKFKGDITKRELSRLLHDAWQNVDGLIDAYHHMPNDPVAVEEKKWLARIVEIGKAHGIEVGP